MEPYEWLPGRRKIATFVYKTGFEDIPTDAVEKAKMCILECIGRGLGGIVVRLTKRINAHMVLEMGFGSRVVIRINDGTEYRDAKKAERRPEKPLDQRRTRR